MSFELLHEAQEAFAFVGPGDEQHIGTERTTLFPWLVLRVARYHQIWARTNHFTLDFPPLIQKSAPWWWGGKAGRRWIVTCLTSAALARKCALPQLARVFMLLQSQTLRPLAPSSSDMPE